MTTVIAVSATGVVPTAAVSLAQIVPAKIPIAAVIMTKNLFIRSSLKRFDCGSLVAVSCGNALNKSTNNANRVIILKSPLFCETAGVMLKR
jgi:hypothetical protein